MLIWSRSRPAQVDLLLSSIEKYCPNLFEVNVIKKVENEYREGYILCQYYHKEVNFVSEYNLPKQTKEILQKYDYCCVSTDDTVLFNKFNFNIELMKNVDIFSLRMGLNNNIQNPFTGEKQIQISKYFDEGETICWDSRLYPLHSNPGYLFGHDCVIYSKRYLELIQDLEFKSLNQLESYLITNSTTKINPFIRSFKHSVAVNIPCNNTSGITQTDDSSPLLETNQQFLSGMRFNLGQLDNLKVTGCHQIIDLEMS